MVFSDHNSGDFFVRGGHHADFDRVGVSLFARIFLRILQVEAAQLFARSVKQPIGEGSALFRLLIARKQFAQAHPVGVRLLRHCFRSAPCGGEYQDGNCRNDH
ncbi:hypothetical protein SDC9_205935 [bioreactor metagenome]|uniref:Uncharacterized protein n=1 Tax=bioreactor metagenome TaxID=1076179 RepID=A0A645J520_9ZZZZ